MKRSIISLIALILLLSNLLVVPASAAEPAAENTSAITPRFVNIELMSASIDVNSSGKASCYSYVDTANSTYKIYVSMSLQRYVDGYWTNVKTWNSSGTGAVTLDKSYYVTSGYYYRTAMSATVYTSGGSFVESEDITSQNDYY